MTTKELTSSISKGVFIFKKDSKQKIKKSEIKLELWEESFQYAWKIIETELKILHNQSYTKILKNVINYIKTTNSDKRIIDRIPTVALMTGINLPDHEKLFETLKTTIKNEVSPHVAILNSDTCTNLKNMIENMVYQFILEDLNEFDTSVIKKSACTFLMLKFWYENIYDSKSNQKKNLVVILSDLESFDPTILQDFILIFSSYLQQIPVAFVFGIATSLDILNGILPYQVLSKLHMEIFQAQSSVTCLNEIVDNIFLNSFLCPFRLSSKCFNLLVDQFLFYDFSVKRFVQAMKFTIFEHFYNNPYAVLCVNQLKTKEIVEKLTLVDLNVLRRSMLSFRKYVEEQNSNKNKIKLIEDDVYFRKMLYNELIALHKYFVLFDVALKLLHILVNDLPKNPLGTQLRELYCLTISTNILEKATFQECFQLLKFLAKDQLILKIEKIHQVLIEFTKFNLISNEINNILSDFEKLIVDIKTSTNDLLLDYNRQETTLNESFDDASLTRTQLKKKLFEQSKKKTKSFSRYEEKRNEFFDFLMKLFENYLQPITQQTFFEIFYYSDFNRLKNHLIGTTAGSLHVALNNPHYYLQCKCCKLKMTNTINSKLPVLSIVYKLHLEYGKLINLYDWLQSFSLIVSKKKDEDNVDDEENISPEIQLRFTKAVSELQFLGFIKSSKRKVDHVARLTWGMS